MASLRCVVYLHRFSIAHHNALLYAYMNRMHGVFLRENSFVQEHNRLVKPSQKRIRIKSYMVMRHILSIRLSITKLT